MEFYIKRNNKKAGPFTEQQLKQLGKEGKVKSTDLIVQGTKEITADKVQGLFSSKTEIVTQNTTIVQKIEEVECEYCGELIKPNAKKCRFCGEILDSSLIKNQIQPQIQPQMQPTINIVNSSNATATATAKAKSTLGSGCLWLIVAFFVISMIGMVISAVEQSQKIKQEQIQKIGK